MSGKSLLSNMDEPVCLVCGTPSNLHVHHIYPGIGRRETSDREGCWCYLCAAHHNMSDAGVHFDRVLDRRIRQECQRRWEQKRGSRADFIRLFSRSYLED